MVRSVSRLLHEWSAVDVLRGPTEFTYFEPGHIHAALDQLKPERLVLTVVSPDAKTDQVTRYYGTHYSLDKIAKPKVEQWSNVQQLKGIQLPRPNPFIPHDLDLVEESDRGQPEQLDGVDGVELWHHTDTSFNMPSATLYALFRSDAVNSSARNYVLSEMFVRLVEQQLNEFTYPAELAGIRFKIFRTDQGVGIYLVGYSDKQELLLNRVINSITSFSARQSHFERTRDDLMRDIRDLDGRRPINQAISEIQSVLKNPYWSDAQRIEALEEITLNDINEHASTLLHGVSPLIVSHGNITEEESIARATMVRSALESEVSIQERKNRVTVVKVKRNDKIGSDLSINHSDSVATLYIQADKVDAETKAQFALLSQILNVPFYHEIRTQRQLGYFVSASEYSVMHVPGLRFSIQSPTSTPETLFLGIQQFIENYEDELEGLSSKTFLRHRNALISRFAEADKRLLGKSQRYWDTLYRQEYDFDSAETAIGALSKVTQPDILTLYRDLLVDASRGRIFVWSRGDSAIEGDTHSQFVLPEIVDNRDEFLAERAAFDTFIPSVVAKPRVH